VIESYQRTLRFLRQFARARQTGDEYEILIDGEGAPPRAATLYASKSAHRARSGWVLLHGITVPGRHHLALRRMARALAAAGDVVVVPEVPRWTALEVTSREAGPAVQAGLSVLAGRHGVDPSRVGIMGFSVAATWALAFAARSDHIAVVVGVGGYGALQPLLRAMVVGEYEWDGVTGSYIPDPYGRWIMGSTLLPLLDGETYGRLDERRAAARALGELARTAGRHGAYAGQRRSTTVSSTSYATRCPPGRGPHGTCSHRSPGTDRRMLLPPARWLTRWPMPPVAPSLNSNLAGAWRGCTARCCSSTGQVTGSCRTPRR